MNPLAGAAIAESEPGAYRITGGGANVWGKLDAFHFLWRKVSGDVTITAEIEWVGEGKHAHRKAMLMLRQSLAAESAYADAALHGDGLLSLQYRSAAGALTEEKRATGVEGRQRFRLVKQGETVSLYTAPPAGAFELATTAQIKLDGLFYVGLGVCSHDENTLETAIFRKVAVQHPPVAPLRSRVEIYDVARKTRRVVYEAEGLWEAPNWSRDGKHLLLNSRGRLFRLALEGQAAGEPLPLSIPEAYRCNNDHDYSRDGRWVAFSASTQERPASHVYVAKADGTDVRLVSRQGPSYFHGWSPDGRWLAYVGQRARKFELYRAAFAGSVANGEEQRLTSAGGFDDGPDYSPDGKWIYFNSDRSGAPNAGAWDIWRIPSEGAGDNDQKAERVTQDGGEDWFPHPAPNGKSLVFLTFPEGTIGHNGRMPGVALRRLAANAKGAPETLFTFTGGQGSINVNSWSPDSKHFAFVSYELPAVALPQ
ncbi:MAG: SMP-30/gluconolactonase/LRE family protein [Bryobacter sp.]